MPFKKPITPPAPFGRPMVPGTSQATEASRPIQPSPLFAEYAFRPAYNFPGLNPFLDDAAEAVGWKDHGLRSRIKSDWFYIQAANNISNAANRSNPMVSRDCLARARLVRDALHLAIHAIDDAIDMVESKLNLPKE